MSHYLTAIAAALIAALPVLAAAQDQTSEEATEETTEDAAPAADGNEAGTGELSMGQPVEPGEPVIGETYVDGTFGDWELRCVRTEDGADPCQLYQLLADDQGNSVAEISLFNLPEGGQAEAGATIITPLETLLTEQLQLSVDGGTARVYPFSFCSQLGCFARVGFTEEEVAQFRAGVQGILSIVPAAAPDQTVNLTVSLSGFTAGYAAVVEANAN